MNENFIKLKIKHEVRGDCSDISMLQGEIADVYTVKQEVQNKLFSYFSTLDRTIFIPKLVVVKKNFAPHIHMDSGSGINFYVKTCNEVTNFYQDDFKNNVEDLGGYVINYLNDLPLIDTFIANEGDAFLLNPRVPHSVSCPNNGTRIFISLTTSLSYYELCELTKDYWE